MVEKTDKELKEQEKKLKEKYPDAEIEIDTKYKVVKNKDFKCATPTELDAVGKQLFKDKFKIK